MSKDKQIDRIIRNKLKYHASTSPDHLWDAIDAQLVEDEKKDRGGFWWKTSGLMLGVLLVGMFAYVMLQQQTVNDNITDRTFTAAESTQENKDINNTTSKAPIADRSNSEAVTSSVVSSTPQGTNQPTLSTSTAITGNTKKNTPPNRNINNKAVPPKDIPFSNTKMTTSDEDATSASNTSATNAASSEAYHPTAEASTSVTDASYAIPSAIDLPSTDITFSVEENELDWPAFMVDPKCATFGKWLKLYFYGDFYFSPDFAFRKLESKGADYEMYTASREATESQSFSYSAGARVSVVSNYGVAFRTGLVYTQINEVFDYENEREERISIENIYDDDGNLIRTDTVIEVGVHKKTTYNHYRMIDIPLILGYEVNFKKFTLALNSGVYANLSSTQKGDFLSPELEPVTFSTASENRYPAFRRNLNISLYGSFTCLYNLNERWQLMLEPQFRYYLDPLTRPDYMVEQRYVTTGLNTGLRYRF